MKPIMWRCPRPWLGHSGAPRSCAASPESITAGGTDTERPGVMDSGLAGILRERQEPAPRNDSAYVSNLKIDEVD